MDWWTTTRILQKLKHCTNTFILEEPRGSIFMIRVFVKPATVLDYMLASSPKYISPENVLKRVRVVERNKIPTTM